MNWFNEPSSWKVEYGNLEMKVTPESDYWRKTQYGFTVDDGSFYYTTSCALMFAFEKYFIKWFQVYYYLEN